MAEGVSITSMLLAGLCGGIVGAALTVMVRSHRRRVTTEREARRERIAAWLAAYIGVGRASVSFVAAFRSLAAACEGTAYYGLRQEEAQRARAQWSRAVERLDLAEAKLHIWHAGSELIGCVDRMHRISAVSLRAAIDGDEAATDRFIQMVMAMQQEATVVVAGTEDKQRAAFVHDILGRAVAGAEAIVDSWARR